MDTLRFITCGSVDDGKSTLIGRLLYETKLIFQDQLEALKQDSQKFGTQGERLDFALLVDGLQAERHTNPALHCRRYARTRTVHPQHGDWSLDGASCDFAD
ncbi:MAG TPA: GTP-binding protein [Nitrospira sp.]|nr:GTP-binding protein [Nitrospira sp.]